MIKNKKGNAIIIITFFVILFVILFVGFLMVIGSAILNWGFDEVIPELISLGNIGSANMTDIASYTVTPMNTFVQNIPWLVGVIYIMMLVGSFGFIIIMRTTPSRWLISLYFALAILLIIACIFISNIYEDFYDGTDELAIRLKEHTILSYMILYSPLVFTIMVFITGIFLFSGMQQEEFV